MWGYLGTAARGCVSCGMQVSPPEIGVRQSFALRCVLAAAWLVLAGLVAAIAGCAAMPCHAGPEAVKREIRGLWVATVANIDWPSRTGLGTEDLRKEMIAILDRARALNLNAVFLQVRPACDAVYPSALEPWTEFLSGTQGQAPAEGYDPLAEWIAAAHARGIELHAWFNPYRARHAAESSPAAPSHVSRTDPGIVRSFDKMLWLDPGEPAARDLTLAVILDVVQRYDVDGVHLDDYFYPYPKQGIEFDDGASFARYTAAGGTFARDDWRRGNVDDLVRRIHEQTRREKPWVAVSISPFGIWRPGHPAGVTGFDAYAGLHADSMKWVREGWVDLLVPQVYWRLSSAGQPHASLVEWWSASMPTGPRLAVGLIPSRVQSAEAGRTGAVIDTKSWPATEVINQIVRGRDVAGVQGFVLFSARPLMENRQGLSDALADGVLAEPALMPTLTRAPACAGSRRDRPRLNVVSEPEHLVVGSAGEPWSEGNDPLVVRAEYPGSWRTFIVPHDEPVRVPRTAASGPLVAVYAARVDRFNRIGRWARVQPAK